MRVTTICAMSKFSAGKGTKKLSLKKTIKEGIITARVVTVIRCYLCLAEISIPLRAFQVKALMPSIPKHLGKFQEASFLSIALAGTA